MSRLIDAEKCPCILCEDTRNAHCTYEHRSCEKFCNWLNNTAFDTEKVVEQLEEVNMNYFLTIANTGSEKLDIAYGYASDSINKAIDIVKKGGVE